MFYKNCKFIFIPVVLVCLAFVGCEENEAALKAGEKSRPREAGLGSNKSPGGISTTKPSARPSSAPASRPANHRPGRVPWRERSDSHVRVPLKPVAAVKPKPQPIRPIPVRPRPVHVAKTPPPPAAQTPPPPAAKTPPADRQLVVFDTLQQRSLDLEYKLQKAEDRNLRLTKALIESRGINRRLQDDVRRNSILLEIRKQEVRDLKDRIARLGNLSAPDRGKDTAVIDPTTAAGEKHRDPLDVMMELGREKRRCEKLKLQLKLARINEPQKMQKILARLGESDEKIEALEKLNRKLSHMVVSQSDEIKALRDGGVELDEELAQARKTIASLKNRLSANQKLLLAMRNAAPPPRREPRVKPQPVAQAVVGAKTRTKTKIPLYVSPSPPEPLRPISGKISAVKDFMIMIDVGGKAGVEKGMRMIVYRDDKFIGYLRVEQVGEKESTCIFTRKIHQPKVGDKVIDRLD